MFLFDALFLIFFLNFLDCKKTNFVIVLDLLAAFDTMNHTILIDILENLMGLGIKYRKLITSYLSRKKQRFKINESFSKILPLTTGYEQMAALRFSEENVKYYPAIFDDLTAV